MNHCKYACYFILTLDLAMASKEIVGGGVFNANTNIWHGFETSYDKTGAKGGHLGDLEASHNANPNPTYNAWVAHGKLVLNYISVS